MFQYTLQVITHKDIPSWVSILNYNRVSNKFPTEKPKILNIDFTNTHDIKPYHIVSLACLIEEYFQEGVQIKFAQMERENDAVTYLRKLGFFQYWTPGFDRKKFNVCDDRTSFCLWQLDDEMLYPYVSNAQAYFQRHFFVGKDLLPFNRALVEAFHNVIDHSKSMVSGYVFTQFFPKRKQIIISLCDFGLGISGTVNNYFSEKNQPILTSKDAMQWAFTERNTIGSKSNNGGLGLDIISTITKSLRSSLVVISNDVVFDQQIDGTITYKDIPDAFPGTQVVVTLNTQNLNHLVSDEHNIFY